ncbi:MAG: hypothetical protein ACRC50_00630 [Gaiella sp.]
MTDPREPAAPTLRRAEGGGEPLISCRGLLGARVIRGGADLGKVADIIFTPLFDQIVGVEVRGRDAGPRFLPWIAATVEAGSAVEAQSPHALLSSTELAFYLDNGATLVDRLADPFDPIEDVLLDGEGTTLIVTSVPGRDPEDEGDGAL